MKPFGAHREPEGPIQSVDGNKISPAEAIATTCLQRDLPVTLIRTFLWQFWEYHRRQEAVVLKNVTTSWRAFRKRVPQR